MARDRLAEARHVVVKLGSRTLAEAPAFLDAFAAEVAELTRQGRSIVVVSSGAIAMGWRRLGYRARPREMARLQAAAAAGQSELMRCWDEAFSGHGLTVAQVLLTHADLAHRERLNNAREALAALLEAGAVPIINENDTVATEEIHFGDNDQLAAMVVPLVGAELLVLLTDVEGVLDASGARIPVMKDGVEIGALPAARSVGSGGIASKIDAARKAARAGAWVVIARAARPGVLRDAAGGADVGTLFCPSDTALRARKHWIAYTLRPSGTVLLDDGAVRALASGRSSLLPVGVVGVRGQFNPGDSVRLVDRRDVEVGRGLTRLGALDVARAAGLKGAELEARFGARAAELVVVHKDDLVLAP
ncbi:MAG: glutamate 5-kinase [Sorangiineae bacterium]|nr:glutamate 5-kinase [Polyangiaceae bacterium]MEB2324380.1 glutamate 5-kinase [Sorangiineae bacterium]